MIINALIMGIVVAGTILTAICLFNSDNNDKDDGWCSNIGQKGWLFAILAGVIVGVALYLATTTELAVLSLIVLIAANVCFCLWWKRDGNRPKEIVPFIILAVLIWLSAESAAWKVTSFINSTFLTSVITMLPTLMLVISIGFFVVDLLCFRASDVDASGSKLQKRDLVPSRVAIGATILIAVVLLATMTACSVAKGDDDWPHFYHHDVATDDDPDNNFNFGPSAFTEGADAESVYGELKDRLEDDPALAAAIMATIDAKKIGTPFLGEFYESCEGVWEKTMNSAKDCWLSDREAYLEKRDKLLERLDTAEVEIRDCQSVSDQMYMCSDEESEVPYVRDVKTDDHSGHEIVFSWQIKENTFEIALRLECGFQPTDVAEIMGIEAQDYATFVASVTPGGDTSTPDNPTPSYNKDPNKGPKENTEPNDDSGSGSNTSSGGGNSSTEEKSTNSNNYSSYDEYRKDMDAMNDAGTDYGGIDKPTEVTEPVKEAGTGDSIDSSPGKVWGGPTD